MLGSPFAGTQRNTDWKRIVTDEKIGRKRTPTTSRAAAAAGSEERNVGMREIAERAKVTKMTVSRALRAPSKVAEKTLKRIHAAMEEMGYVPNHLAGALSTRTSRIVVVIVPSLADSIFASFLEELVASLDAAGYTPVFGSSNFDSEYEERLLYKYLGWHPSAIVLTGDSQTPRAKEFCRRSGIPIVQTWSLPENPIGSVVGFSNEDGTYRMTKAVLGWGHRRIGFGYINTPPNNDRTIARLNGWRRAMVEAYGDIPGTMSVGGPFSRESGGAMVRYLLERHPDLDAIVFGSDVLAVGALTECRRLGIRVPQDLAITGFGDMGLATVSTPQLTTVRIPTREVGRVCAETIKRLVVDPTPTVERLELEIVRRESA